jgi:hypothetical protein
VTTAAGPERHGMTGRERMLLYAVAIQTGLRSSECSSLTRGRLFLDGTQPYIVCKARSTKNAKDCKQYIQPDLAAELAGHIATKAPAARVFNMPPKWDVAPMFRADLADARKAWLDAAHSPEERLRREQSDFLAYANHEREKVDFHALRHTTGAWLAMAGVHPKVVQTVMRHSAITLTMDTYGHLFPGQDAAAVAALPSMMSGPQDSHEAERAKGTDDAAARYGSRSGSSWAAKPCPSLRATCESDQDTQNSGDDPNVLPINDLRGTLRESSRRFQSEVVGARTQDLRIKSPLLYRLSYNLESQIFPVFRVFSCFRQICSFHQRFLLTTDRPSSILVTAWKTAARRYSSIEPSPTR